jgi:site-specific recombinase XerD
MVSNDETQPTSPMLSSSPNVNVIAPNNLQTAINSALGVAQRSLAEGTLSNYRGHIERFKKWCTEQNVTYQQLSPELPHCIIGYLQAAFMSNNTAMSTIDVAYSAINHYTI